MTCHARASLEGVALTPVSWASQARSAAVRRPCDPRYEVVSLARSAVWLWEPIADGDRPSAGPPSSTTERIRWRSLTPPAASSGTRKTPTLSVATCCHPWATPAVARRALLTLPELPSVPAVRIHSAPALSHPDAAGHRPRNALPLPRLEQPPSQLSVSPPSFASTCLADSLSGHHNRIQHFAYPSQSYCCSPAQLPSWCLALMGRSRRLAGRANGR